MVVKRGQKRGTWVGTGFETVQTGFCWVLAKKMTSKMGFSDPRFSGFWTTFFQFKRDLPCPSEKTLQKVAKKWTIFGPFFTGFWTPFFTRIRQIVLQLNTYWPRPRKVGQPSTEHRDFGFAVFGFLGMW